MITNLLPRDTRSSEIASALGMIFLSMAIFGSKHVTVLMFMLHPAEFWAMVLFVIGSIQLVSLTAYPKLEIVRGITAFISGMWWVWQGTAMLQQYSYPTNWIALTVGIANMYGASITFLYLRRSWES